MVYMLDPACLLPEQMYLIVVYFTVVTHGASFALLCTLCMHKLPTMILVPHPLVRDTVYCLGILHEVGTV